MAITIGPGDDILVGPGGDIAADLDCCCDDCPTDCCACCKVIEVAVTCPGGTFPGPVVFTRTGDTCAYVAASIGGYTISNLECKLASETNACTHNPSIDRWTFCIQIISPGACGTPAPITNFWIAKSGDCPPTGSYTTDNSWTGTGSCDTETDGCSCPSNCDACDDPITVTVTGGAGGAQFCTPPGTKNCNAEVNQVYSVSRTTCSWTGAGVSDAQLFCDISCSGTTWGLDIRCAIGTVMTFTAPNTDGCPPATGWTFSGGSLCSAGAVTLS